MSSTADSERPPAPSEKESQPLIDHITTDTPEDSYPDSENPAKLKNAKNIGTTTPEVEGEDNEPVIAVEDYPNTPVSTMDSSFQALPLTGESRDDPMPLPPTPEEPGFGAGGEAETTSLPLPTEAGEKQLDGAEEPKAEVEEDSDMVGDKVDSKSAEGKEVVEADERIEVPESLTTEQESSEDKAVDLKTEEESLETPVEKVEEGPTPEAANLEIPEPDAPKEEPSEDAPGANEEEPAAIDETSTVLDASDLDTEVLRTAEPVEGNDGESKEVIDTEYQDNTESQTTQDSDSAIDESKAGETDTTIGGHEPKQESEAVPALEADSLPSLEEGSVVAEGSEMAQSEVENPKAGDAPEPTAPSEAEEAKETRPEATETAGAEPEEGSLLLEEGAEVAEESKDKVEDEPKKDPETLKEESEGEPNDQVEPKTAEPTEAEPPGVDFLSLTEPPKEEVPIPSSTAGEDTPDSEPAKESTEDVKEESKSKTSELVEVELQTAEVLPVTEPSKEEDDYPPVEADTGVEPGLTEESKEDMKVEIEYEVEEEPKSETAEISELAKAEPAALDALPLIDAPKEEVPSVDVDANPQSEPAEEPKEDEREVPNAEPPVEGLAETPGETVDSTSEGPEGREEAGVPVATGASPDGGPSQELKEIVATEPEVPAVPEQSAEPEESREPQIAPESTEKSVDKVNEMDPEPDIPKDGEQEAQATPIQDKAKPEESEHKSADADVKEVAPVEIHEGSDAPAIPETEIGGGVSADAGPEASMREREGIAKSEPVTRSEPKEVFTEAPVEDDKLSELVEVPTGIAEKAVDNQPSHGGGLGSDVAERQKEAFEKQKADAELDEVMTKEKSPTPQIVPVEEHTFEPTPGDSEAASSESTDGIKAEPATNPAADEKGEGFAQDEPIIVSHDDAPPDEVEKAEAAVEYPRSDPQDEAAEAPKETEAVRDGKAPVSPEKKHDGELEEPSSVEELVAIAAVVAEETTASETDDDKDLTQETSAGPALVSDDASSIPATTVAGDKLDQDSREGAVTSGPTTPEDTQQAAKEEASVEEPEEKGQEFSAPPLPSSQTIGNPIDLAPGQKAPEEFKVSAEDAVQAEDNPSEAAGAKPSEIPLPVTGDVKPAIQPEASVESQPEEQIFSVNPLPDSKTFGNPINLQPGEPIPVCLTEASVADNVKLDEEIFQKPEDKAPIAEEANAEGSDDRTGEKILAAGVGASLVGLGAYAAVARFDDGTEAGERSSDKAPPAAVSPADRKVGSVLSPAVDVPAKSIPSTAQAQVLPVEVSFTIQAIPKELSESPVVSKTGIEPISPVDKSIEEIAKPTGTEVPDKKPLQASAIDILDESAVNQSVGKSGSDKGDEVIAEPAPQNFPSPVDGAVAPEEHVPKALKDTVASETPAIVVSTPPNPATGSGTTEVIQPSSSEVAFNEASANKARESENTPEGVRRRRAPGAGGEVSRPTSSGADTVSTRHHRNIMEGFWHVVLFGWLGGFGRFFGGIFSKSRSRKQRK